MSAMTRRLVCAYGMFWQVDNVAWMDRSWQMLGKRGSNAGTVKVCDFRHARGIYILFNDFGANYVGMARGSGGIGARLRKHQLDRQSHGTTAWTRFCWFSFDELSTPRDGWLQVHKKETVRRLDAEGAVREMEALLITVLGVKHQNQMRFLDADEWDQVTINDTLPGRALHKVDTGPLKDPWLRESLEEWQE